MKVINWFKRILKMHYPCCSACNKRMRKHRSNCFYHPIRQEIIHVDFGYISYQEIWAGFVPAKLYCCDLRTELYRLKDSPEDYFIMRYENEMIASGTAFKKNVISYINDLRIDSPIPMPKGIESFTKIIARFKRMGAYL